MQQHWNLYPSSKLGGSQGSACFGVRSHRGFKTPPPLSLSAVVMHAFEMFTEVQGRTQPKNRHLSQALSLPTGVAIGHKSLLVVMHYEHPMQTYTTKTVHLE